MTAADEAVLNSLAAEIDSIKNDIRAKTDRVSLINSSFASGNFQPFGALTVGDENAIKPQLNTEKNALGDAIAGLNTLLQAKIKAFADAKKTILSPTELDAIAQTGVAQAKAAEAEANAKANAVAAESTNKLFAQKSTTYLIVGGIAAAILVIGVILYKRYAK